MMFLLKQKLIIKTNVIYDILKLIKHSETMGCTEKMCVGAVFLNCVQYKTGLLNLKVIWHQSTLEWN